VDIHLTLNREAPLRAQLERELRAAIRSGRLRPGVKLPPSRVLAGELEVSRGVVVEAYSQLVAEGYLVARSGDGTRIADGLAQQPPAARAPSGPAPRIRYDLRSGVPDLSFFPRRELQSAMATVLRELPDAAFSYGSRRGARGLRLALADYLGRARAVVADPERLFIAAGAAHGMGILWQALKQRGARRVAIEDPAWRAIPQTIVQAGLEVVPVAVDDDGFDVGRLEQHHVDAVVLSPAHQYPTGTILAPARRSELIAWARRRGAAPTRTTGSRICSGCTCTAPTGSSRTTSTLRSATPSASAPIECDWSGSIPGRRTRSSPGDRRTAPGCGHLSSGAREAAAA